MSSIAVEELTKRFDSNTAVDHLSFKVKQGEVFGLLGPNGAGKTTTVRMLACLIYPTEGSAFVNGYDITREPLKIREGVGILTENPSLYERLTVYENLNFFAEAYGISDTREKRMRIRELLDFFDLWERRKYRVGTLSMGMKQKLSIARTLVHNPPILLLDEPTAGLDPESAKGIRDLMDTLSRQEKHTILLCTHRLEDAERLCRRVMIINNGKRVIIGTPEELQGRIGGKPTIQVTLKKLDPKITKAIREDERVKEINVDDDVNSLIISVNDFTSSTPEIVRKIVNMGGLILSVNTIRPSLEEAYLSLVREEKS